MRWLNHQWCRRIKNFLSTKINSIFIFFEYFIFLIYYIKLLLSLELVFIFISEIFVKNNFKLLCESLYIIGHLLRFIDILKDKLWGDILLLLLLVKLIFSVNVRNRFGHHLLFWIFLDTNISNFFEKNVF